MEGLRQQIHTAFCNVAQICDQYFRKYPYPSQIPYDLYRTNPYQRFQRVGQFPLGVQQTDNWYSNPNPYTQTSFNMQKNMLNGKSKNQKKSKPNIPILNSDGKSSKQTPKVKDYEKKVQKLKQEKKKQLEKIKNMKVKKNTLKQQIKRDPRLAQKPKHPLSPYFMFLHQMRQSQEYKEKYNSTNNKYFAQQMGKKWRELDQAKKDQYIAVHLKQRAQVEKQLKKFYQKYPDLQPKWKPKKGERMYQYDQKHEQLNNQPELQHDLIDEQQINYRQSPQENVNENLDSSMQRHLKNVKINGKDDSYDEKQFDNPDKETTHVVQIED